MKTIIIWTYRFIAIPILIPFFIAVYQIFKNFDRLPHDNDILGVFIAISAILPSILCMFILYKIAPWLTKKYAKYPKVIEAVEDGKNLSLLALIIVVFSTIALSFFALALLR